MTENIDDKIEEITDSIDDIVKGPSPRKVWAVDTAATVIYSIASGSAFDYASGLDLTGIIASRATGIVFNAVTGGPYGWWREKVYKITGTKEDSGKIRKFLAEMLATNTFQTPTYCIMIAVGSLVSEGYVDFEKIKNGMIYVTAFSPLLCTTIGWFIDKFRRLFGISPAAKGAYKKKVI
jgi:hypothetical protein